MVTESLHAPAVCCSGWFGVPGLRGERRGVEHRPGDGVLHPPRVGGPDDVPPGAVDPVGHLHRRDEPVRVGGDELRGVGEAAQPLQREPEESPGAGGPYRATYMDRAPGGITLYTANVTDLGAEAAKEGSPRDHLIAFKTAFQKDEVSRKEIEHGPKKRPGLDIVSNRSGKVSREVVVAAGSRLYSVSVTAPTEEALRAPQAAAFFDSFSVEE